MQINRDKSAIVMIAVDELYPHPNNPRKQLGDLTELTESIKKNGVLQNLTVVAREAGGYTLIIGHRRCAASKAAGLSALPCVVAELTEREQIGMMLCENMQRADITPYEQAQSMQMMLDLGETVAAISEKTGLTRRTVKDRLKLATLDGKKLQKACERQVTLAELLKVADLADEKARDEVLGKAGTANFCVAYEAAKDREEKEKKMALMREHLSAWARERSAADKDEDGLFHDVYRTFISSRDKEDILIGKLDEAKAKYGALNPRWREDSYGFTLYSDKTADEVAETEMRARQREQTERIDALFDRLKEISKRHYEMRLDFVRGIRLGTSAYTDVLLQEYLTRRIENNTYGDTTYVRRVLDSGKSDAEAAKRIKQYKGRPEDLLFLMVYGEMRDTEEKHYVKNWKNGTWEIEYRKNERLSEIYEFLCRYGYELSDDEIDMREGRHEVYRQYLEEFGA